MKKRNFKKRLRIEQLEGRRLLAADLSIVDLVPTEVGGPETVMCEVAQIEAGSETLDFETTELPVDIADPVDSVTTDLQPEAEQQPEVETESEVLAYDLGDPVDGTDGFFGSIDAESSNQSFEITPSARGMVDVVVSSSLGDAQATLELTDANGNAIDFEMTQQVAGFQQLTFESEAGETYQLNVSAQDGVEGYFQVTASFDADLHADIVGDDSTQLDLVDGAASLDGNLETAGDVDTFQFTAEADGKVSLGLAELNPDNSTELQVQVIDSAGEALTRGITNETVGISFDVESGGQYFLAISAGEGQTGSYGIEMNLEAVAVEPEVEPEVELEPEVEPEVVLEVEPEMELEPEVETEVEPEVGVEAEMELEPEVEVEPEPEVETVLGLEPEVEPEPEPVPEVEPEMELQPEVESEVDPEVEPVVDLQVAQIGEDATEVAIVDGVAFIAGELETADDTDAHELSPTLTEAQFDVNVDPIDELETGDELSEVEVVGDTPELTDVVDAVVDSTDDEMEVCFTEAIGENEVVDSIFENFNPDSLFSFAGQFGLRRG